jgi:hypothetical protein
MKISNLPATDDVRMTSDVSPLTSLLEFKGKDEVDGKSEKSRK